MKSDFMCPHQAIYTSYKFDTPLILMLLFFGFFFQCRQNDCRVLFVILPACKRETDSNQPHRFMGWNVRVRADNFISIPMCMCVMTGFTICKTVWAHRQIAMEFKKTSYMCGQPCHLTGPQQNNFCCTVLCWNKNNEIRAYKF